MNMAERGVQLELGIDTIYSSESTKRPSFREKLWKGIKYALVPPVFLLPLVASGVFFDYSNQKPVTSPITYKASNWKNIKSLTREYCTYPATIMEDNNLDYPE